MTRRGIVSLTIWGFALLFSTMFVIWMGIPKDHTPPIVPLTAEERAVCEADRRRHKIGNFTIVKGEAGPYFDFGKCEEKRAGEICGKRWCGRKF